MVFFEFYPEYNFVLRKIISQIYKPIIMWGRDLFQFQTYIGFITYCEFKESGFVLNSRFYDCSFFCSNYVRYLKLVTLFLPSSRLFYLLWFREYVCPSLCFQKSCFYLEVYTGICPYPLFSSTFIILLFFYHFNSWELCSAFEYSLGKYKLYLG